MAGDSLNDRRTKFWIGVIAIIILLLFLYFYQPFETYLTAHIPYIQFSNVVFWFASLVGVVGYVIAQWQSFKTQIFRSGSELRVDNLLFDTLQASILIAVIFAAGATLQAVVMLGEHLVNRGPIIDPSFGGKLLAIILLLILALLFCLLHYVVRAFRDGWTSRRAHPASARPSGAD
ncbi:MAG: small integral membrane protein 12 [Minwuiales bacterium]|nr:small integral membrane protein 12 [Minwuiales bacterium]